MANPSKSINYRASTAADPNADPQTARVATESADTGSQPDNTNLLRSELGRLDQGNGSETQTPHTLRRPIPKRPDAKVPPRFLPSTTHQQTGSPFTEKLAQKELMLPLSNLLRGQQLLGMDSNQPAPTQHLYIPTVHKGEKDEPYLIPTRKPRPPVPGYFDSRSSPSLSELLAGGPGLTKPVTQQLIKDTTVELLGRRTRDERPMQSEVSASSQPYLQNKAPQREPQRDAGPNENDPALTKRLLTAGKVPTIILTAVPTEILSKGGEKKHMGMDKSELREVFQKPKSKVAMSNQEQRSKIADLVTPQESLAALDEISRLCGTHIEAQAIEMQKLRASLPQGADVHTLTGSQRWSDARTSDLARQYGVTEDVVEACQIQTPNGMLVDLFLLNAINSLQSSPNSANKADVVAFFKALPDTISNPLLFLKVIVYMHHGKGIPKPADVRNFVSGCMEANGQADVTLLMAFALIENGKGLLDASEVNFVKKWATLPHALAYDKQVVTWLARMLEGQGGLSCDRLNTLKRRCTVSGGCLSWPLLCTVMRTRSGRGLPEKKRIDDFVAACTFGCATVPDEPLIVALGELYEGKDLPSHPDVKRLTLACTTDDGECDRPMLDATISACKDAKQILRADAMKIHVKNWKKQKNDEAQR